MHVMDHPNTYPPPHSDLDEEMLQLSEHFHPSNNTKCPTYDDGNSIDWLREESAERERRRGLKYQRGVRGLLLPFMDASRIWFVVVVTGVGIGVTGAWLDVLVRW
jgi:chloride channel 3/4/5